MALSNGLALWAGSFTFLGRVLCYIFIMIAVEEALDKVPFPYHSLGSEKVSILEALGRVMAEDIDAHRDIPPWIIQGWMVMRSVGRYTECWSKPPRPVKSD